MSKKLSIIIPYYNTYDYTRDLLTELKRQFTPEIEVILIDDGCHEERFDTFKLFTIIHLDKNYGASSAWHRGIEKSSGSYIAFIDSDDMIRMDYVKVLLKAIDEHNEDEIIFNWYDVAKDILVKRPSNRGIWKAIYKKEICPRFKENWKYCTDLPFSEQLKNTPHTKFYLDELLYFYRSQREGSITWNRIHSGEPYVNPREQDKL